MIEMNRLHEDLRVVSTGDILAYRGQAPVEQLHAEESEGSFLMAYYPEAIRREKMLDFSPKCTASAFDLVGIGGVTPLGVWGYQSRGTAEAGRTDMAERISQSAAYIRRTFGDLERRYGK